jgi:hypothetical protein
MKRNDLPLSGPKLVSPAANRLVMQSVAAWHQVILAGAPGHCRSASLFRRSPDTKQGGGHHAGGFCPQAIFSQCYRNKSIF